AGRDQEALDLYERVLTDSERILGPNHPDTIDARNNIIRAREAAAAAQQADTATPSTAPDCQPPSANPK
ncbi:tetratricopeptide repeat protein, partial [Streptomyces sp. MA5143a]|uniref:tetratricopeptide repeat protein n=1 Tax=Streptomyces sp. MA5143a TaxID=2083010 RepID=UPI0011B1F3DC